MQSIESCCFDFMIVLLKYSRKSKRSLWRRVTHIGGSMKLISSLIICLALSACAADYVSQLSGPNYGLHVLNSDENVDSRLLMNGVYAPKPFGVSPYAATPYAPSCLTAEYRCSPQAQSAWSSFEP